MESSSKPLGLQRLAALDRVEVLSKRAWMSNTFEFREESGELLFNAREEERGFSLLSCGFHIALLDANGVEVISLQTPSSICTIGKVKVSIQGELASIVKQKLTFMTPLLEIHDAAAGDAPAYMIKGPSAFQNLSGDVQFQLMTLDKRTLGAISKKTLSWRDQLYKQRDDFTVTFPRDLDARYKAACLGACVYIIYGRRQR